MRRSRKREQGNRSPPNPEQTLLTDWTGGNVVPAGPELVARSALGWKGRSGACPPREEVSCEANSRPPKREFRQGCDGATWATCPPKPRDSPAAGQLRAVPPSPASLRKRLTHR